LVPRMIDVIKPWFNRGKSTDIISADIRHGTIHEDELHEQLALINTEFPSSASTSVFESAITRYSKIAYEWSFYNSTTRNIYFK
jgi:hypothetical protein